MNLDNKTIKQINKQIDTAWKKNHKAVDKEWNFMTAEEQRRQEDRVETQCKIIAFCICTAVLIGLLYFAKIILK